MARLVLFVVGCLLAQAVSVPAGSRRPGNRYRPLRDSEDEAIEVNNVQGTDLQSTSSTSGYDVDDDDEFEDAMQPAPSTGGGSNLISLINLASALFPSASGANGSSQGSADQLQSPLWTLKMDIMRAVLQFGTSILGLASASFTRAVTI